MRSYALSHLGDGVLLRRLSTLVERDRITLAALLAHLAEVDARRLYAPAGCPSMYAYCVERLGLSEDAAYNRIRAARAAREFPALFAAVARGHLHLAAVCLLAPHLMRANARALIAAARQRSKAEIERWLAERFARPVQELIAPVEGVAAAGVVAAGLAATAAAAAGERPPLSPGQAEAAGLAGSAAAAAEVFAGPALADSTAPSAQLAPGRVAAARCARVALRIELPLATQDKLRRAQALLSHAVPSGDVATVFDRALDALLARLERRKFAATARPRMPRSGAPRAPRSARTVVASVRRAVWARDGGRCTFVGAEGLRCSARRLLEFDHVRPVARGGPATAANLRLRCRTHNQLEAEREFGVEFMQARRQRARAAPA